MGGLFRHGRLLGDGKVLGQVLARDRLVCRCGEPPANRSPRHAGIFDWAHGYTGGEDGHVPLVERRRYIDQSVDLSGIA